MVESEIPKPEDSGSDGTQIKAEGETQELVPAQPLAPSVAQAITGLASSHSRAFGGEVASTLIAGATSQMATELHETKQELASVREKTEALNSQLTDERVRSAVLTERLDSFRSTRHLKNIGVAVGTLLFGFGIQFARSGNVGVGVTSTVIGGVVILISWLSVPKEGDK